MNFFIFRHLPESTLARQGVRLFPIRESLKAFLFFVQSKCVGYSAIAVADVKFHSPPKTGEKEGGKIVREL